MALNNVYERNQKKFTSQSDITSSKLLISPLTDVFAFFENSSNGYSTNEAEKLIKSYGYNEFTKKKKHNALISFLTYFKNPLVIILGLASILEGILSDFVDASIILCIILLSIIFNYFQESKAEKAAELLKEKVTTTATVLRDNIKKELPLANVIPGDIIFLSAGDIVPGDARIITAKDLFVNQSALTGESFPVEKSLSPIKSEESSITEWNNCLFMGTSIVSGNATAVIIKTGNYTEYGKIAKKIIEKEPDTEFEKGIRNFGLLIIQVIFVLVIFVFFINAYFKHDVIQALLFSVALAVGLTPDLLPMIITVNLSKGALNMSKKGVIVKRLSSIENLGSMNVLCTDKTGTLTENKIKLLKHINSSGLDDDKVFLQSYLNSFYQTGLKSPLDEAILKHQQIQIDSYTKIDEIPFDFQRRRVSVVVEQNRERSFITKGAPEEILKVSSYCEHEGRIVDLSPDLVRKFEQMYFDLSSDGFRVLAVSYKKLKDDKQSYSVNDEKDMIFSGYVVFLDPPKETARESLKLLRNLGIDLKILTGDNELVTRKTCEYLQFDIKGVITGSEISQMTEESLQRVVEEINIFSRVSPAQKSRILNALKNNGHVVGFLGDGINDAPSMKIADVGISVDNAVDVAKESADIILMNKSLRALDEGVVEGRNTFGNTMKYIMMGVSSNFGNMFSVAGASLFLPFLPMLPIQILLNNLLYDLSQSAIPTDKNDSHYTEKPKRWDISFIKNFMLYFGPISSIFDFLTFFIMLTFFHGSEHLFQTAWFVESLCTQTFIIFVIRTRQIPFYKSLPSKYLFFSSIIIIFVGILLPFTSIANLFYFVSPPIAFLGILIIILILYVICVELMKIFFYNRFADRLEQVVITKKRTNYYVNKTTILIHTMIALLSTYQTDTITIDEFLVDLNGFAHYSFNQDQVGKAIQYLRKGSLISFDLKGKTILRTETLNSYMNTVLIPSKEGPSFLEEKRKAGEFVLSKHHFINKRANELHA